MNSRNDAAESSRCLEKFLADRGTALDEVLAVMVRAIRAGCKILVFGNGGSAAESQHFAAELVNKYRRLGQALPAVSLTTDTSALTAIANDLSFDRVFSRRSKPWAGRGLTRPWPCPQAAARPTSSRLPKAARQKKDDDSRPDRRGRRPAGGLGRSFARRGFGLDPPGPGGPPLRPSCPGPGPRNRLPLSPRRRASPIKHAPKRYQLLSLP